VSCDERSIRGNWWNVHSCLRNLLLGIRDDAELAIIIIYKISVSLFCGAEVEGIIHWTL
jgi:hypothetical protein